MTQHIEPLSPEQVRSLLTQPSTTDPTLRRTHAMLCLLMVMRVPLNELLVLRLDQLNLESGTLRYPVKRPGSYDIPDALRDVLARYVTEVRENFVFTSNPESSEGLFPSGMFYMTANMFWRFMTQYAAFQGVTALVTAPVIRETLKLKESFSL